MPWRLSVPFPVGDFLRVSWTSSLAAAGLLHHQEGQTRPAEGMRAADSDLHIGAEPRQPLLFLIGQSWCVAEITVAVLTPRCNAPSPFLGVC